MDEHKNTYQPVKEPMNAVQDVAAVVTEKNHLMIYHSDPFTEPPGWVEYDEDLHKLYIMSRIGGLYDTGLDVQPDLVKRLYEGGDKASILWVVDEKINDIYTVPLVVRYTGYINRVH